MKKKYCLCLIAALALSLTSCGGNGRSSQEDTVTVDSVTNAQNETEFISDEFSTPDLAFADVRGHVARVYFTNDENENQNIFKFDSEGKIESHDYYDFKRLKRDDKGQIVEWGYEEYFVEWEDGRPLKFTIRESDGGESTASYEYNSKGQLIKTTTLYDFPGDEPSTEIVEYSYSDTYIDKHGNWISRNAKKLNPESSWKEHRVIEYQE